MTKPQTDDLGAGTLSAKSENPWLFEVTRAGGYIGNLPILVDTDSNPTDLHDAKEDVRDVAVDHHGRVFLFNGTSTGTGPADVVRLSVFDSVNGTWDHYAGPTGWSIWESNMSSPAFGALALFDDYVFASDTVRSGDEKGIIRFDMSDSFSSQRFADTESYIDLSLGLDGLLYGLRLDFKTVDVFDPATGLSQQQLDVTPSFEVTDIDIEEDGTLIGASQAQRLLFADTSLVSFSIIDLPDPSPNNIDMPGLDSVHLAVIPPGPVFNDGFESGDVSSWSVNVP